jgi:hypothetical protein
MIKNNKSEKKFTNKGYMAMNKVLRISQMRLQELERKQRNDKPTALAVHIIDRNGGIIRTITSNLPRTPPRV